MYIIDPLLTSEDDLIGACNDVKESIADQTSSLTYVLVSEGMESEAHTVK